MCVCMSVGEFCGFWERVLKFRGGCRSQIINFVLAEYQKAGRKSLAEMDWTFPGKLECGNFQWKMFVREFRERLHYRRSLNIESILIFGIQNDLKFIIHTV